MTPAREDARPLQLPAITLHRRGADPLHRQIERALRAEIVRGRWRPGSKLPPEPDLATLLGVNRGTLRRALSALTDAGWLTAAPGRGTFVTDLAKPSIAQRFRSLSEDLVAQGIDFDTEVVDATMVRAESLSLPARSSLGLDVSSGSTEVFRLNRTFRSTNGPLAHLVNTVRADDCPGIADLDFTRTSLFGALADRYGIAIARGRRSFSARSATGPVAGALGVPSGHPVLYIEQVSYTADGDPVEYSDVWLNSDKVAVTSFLERDPLP